MAWTVFWLAPYWGTGTHYLSSLAYTFFLKIWRLDWKSLNEFSVMQQLGLCKDEEMFYERKVGTRWTLKDKVKAR